MKQILVDECPVGVEIDAVVAEMVGDPGYFSDYVVINGTRKDIETWISKDWTPEEPPPGCYAGEMPYGYSIDIWSAWELIDRMGMQYAPSIYQIARWYCSFLVDGERIESCATTAPLAITRAFLRAKGIEFVEVPDETNTG